MTPEELKAQLLAEAEGIINEIVGQDKAQQPKTIDEIEQAELKAGQQVEAIVLAGLVANAALAAGWANCPECGGKLQDKGKRTKWVLPQAGKVQVERDYYHCERCRAGFFPH